MKNDNDWYDLFDFDPFHVGTGVNFGICTTFKQEILADEGDKVVFRDEHGVVKRDRKGFTSPITSSLLMYRGKTTNTSYGNGRK